MSTIYISVHDVVRATLRTTEVGETRWVTIRFLDSVGAASEVVAFLGTGVCHLNLEPSDAEWD